mmetsp:Transcript_111083/g.313364  ORF Transcript_111083/g.313364 Transcript_111083/m.313364 type:complete len:246 (+) Transcript_111083:1710-2447(+)
MLSRRVMWRADRRSSGGHLLHGLVLLLLPSTEAAAPKKASRSSKTSFARGPRLSPLRERYCSRSAWAASPSGDSPLGIGGLDMMPAAASLAPSRAKLTRSCVSKRSTPMLKASACISASSVSSGLVAAAGALAPAVGAALAVPWARGMSCAGSSRSKRTRNVLPRPGPRPCAGRASKLPRRPARKDDTETPTASGAFDVHSLTAGSLPRGATTAPKTPRPVLSLASGATSAATTGPAATQTTVPL